MKELLTAIPEILLARDTPLLKAYNDAVDALAADDLWEKQMQDYMRMLQKTQATQVNKPIYVPPSPNTWQLQLSTTNPASTTGGNSSNYGGG